MEKAVVLPKHIGKSHAAITFVRAEKVKANADRQEYLCNLITAKARIFDGSMRFVRAAITS